MGFPPVSSGLLVQRWRDKLQTSANLFRKSRSLTCCCHCLWGSNRLQPLANASRVFSHKQYLRFLIVQSPPKYKYLSGRACLALFYVQTAFRYAGSSQFCFQRITVAFGVTFPLTSAIHRIPTHDYGICPV